MRPVRFWLGAWVVSAIGCGASIAPVHAPPPAPPPTVAPAATEPFEPPAPDPPEPPEIVDRCADVLAAYPGSGERRFCKITDAGQLWAVAIDGADAAQVIHEDPSGQRASLTVPADKDQRDPSWKGEEAAILYDFDGDGDPELFFTLVSNGYEILVVRSVFVTARGGRVVPYAAAPKGMKELRDVDGDGRPDALVDVELGGYKGCNFCAESDVRETFVAHGRPDGTFSFTDKEARAQVRARCPAPPSGRLVKNDDISPETIVCSRIWGVPRAALLARLAAQCAPHAARAAQCEGPCRYLGLLQMEAALDPPTKL
jgi:hypothetical protein